MSFDLIPKRKTVHGIRIGAFSWPIILEETGCGFLVGYGKGMSPASYVYQSGGKGSPVSNDGYEITSQEAKTMAKLVRGYISVKKYVNKEWDALEEEARRIREEHNKTFQTYTPYTGQQFMETLEKFADFADKSGGFYIH